MKVGDDKQSRKMRKIEESGLHFRRRAYRESAGPLGKKDSALRERELSRRGSATEQ